MAAATTLEVIKKRGDGPHNKIGGHQKTTIWPPQQHWKSSKYENMASTTKSEVIKKCRNQKRDKLHRRNCEYIKSLWRAIENTIKRHLAQKYFNFLKSQFRSNTKSIQYVQIE